MINNRLVLPLALCSVFGAAQAQVNFSNLTATYNLTPNSGTINWQVSQNAPPGTIDFIGNAPAFKVGDSTTFTNGTSSITYDVTSSTAISSIDLVLQGDVEDFGRIQFTEAVNGGALGSTSGSILGVSLGGANGAFTQVIHLNLTQASTSFTVTQGMTSDINGQSLPSTSVALVSLVEQNFNPVPEPATLIGLGLGALAVIRRRKK